MGNLIAQYRQPDDFSGYAVVGGASQFYSLDGLGSVDGLVGFWKPFVTDTYCTELLEKTRAGIDRDFYDRRSRLRERPATTLTRT